MTTEGASVYYTRYYPDRQLEAARFFDEQRRNSAAGYLAKILPAHAKVLDYGSGPGGKTVDLLERSIPVAAYDMNPAYLAFARGKGLLPFASGERFDCIYLSHTIEHWIDLFTDLSGLIRSSLNPGGIVVIEVPLLDRLLLGHKRDGIRAEIQFVHTWYFAVHTLDKLMRQIDCTRFDTDRVTVCAYRYSPGMQAEPVKRTPIRDGILNAAISVCSHPAAAPLSRGVNRVVRYVNVFRSNK